MICGHSCDEDVMVWTGRVEYDGRVVIIIGININRRFLTVYVVAS